MKALLSLILLTTSNIVYAHGEHTIKQFIVSEFQYDSSAYNRGIHSYPILVPSKKLNNINILYIDKSTGSAIYSYPTITTKHPQAIDSYLIIQE